MVDEEATLNSCIADFEHHYNNYYGEHVSLQTIIKRTFVNKDEDTLNDVGQIQISLKQPAIVRISKKSRLRYSLFVLMCLGIISICLNYSPLFLTHSKEKITWNLPRQDHIFVGRENLLADLKHKLHPPANKTLKEESEMLAISACAGLGGIGKTQLALEYIHHSTQPYTLRAWFFAENMDQLNHQYIEFAKSLGYEGDPQAIKRVIAFIKEWLSLHPGWFIVYDNVNNYEEIEAYLPNKGGHILITTRSQIWPGKVKVMPIDIMTEDEAIELVKHLTHSASDQKKQDLEIKELAKTLGYLPLAMAQASAYIHHNQITISEYLNLYKRHTQALLMDNTMPKGIRSLPVAATWNITLEKIFNNSNNHEQGLLALNLLNVCAYLAPEEISRNLLLAWLKESYPTLQSPELILSKLIGELWKYSIIRVGEAGNVTVHRLVQEVLRHQHLNEEKLPYPKLVKAWYGNLLKAAHTEYSRNTQASDDELRRKNLLPHLQSLVNNYDAIWSEEDPASFLANIIQDIGRTFDDILGNYKTAMPFYKRVLKLEKKLHDEYHPNVAIALKDMGKTYRHLRDCKMAQNLLEKSLEINEKIFGKNHKNIGETLIILGHTYRNLYYNDKSLEALERALIINEKEYGKEHLQVAFNLSILGNTYLRLKDYNKALDVFHRAYKIYKNEYGSDHRAIAPVIGNIGDAYWNMGYFKQAQEYLERCLKILEREYGEEHSYIANTLNCLGRTFESQKQINKAQILFEKALKMNEDEFGLNNFVLIDSLLGLGSTYRQLKRYDEAFKVLDRALKISADIHGNNDYTTRILKNYADLYSDLGNLKKHEEYSRRALDAMREQH